MNPSIVSLHADNLLLVRAVLVAGLYPNVVRVDAPPAEKSKDKAGNAKAPKLVTMAQLQSGKMEEQVRKR